MGGSGRAGEGLYWSFFYLFLDPGRVTPLIFLIGPSVAIRIALVGFPVSFLLFIYIFIYFNESRFVISLRLFPFFLLD